MYTGVRQKKIKGIKLRNNESYDINEFTQVSNHFNEGAIIGTFFNRHRDGHPDTGTDLYYLQTRDFGQTWEDIDHRPASLPMTEVDISQRIIDYQSMKKNVYMKDMGSLFVSDSSCIVVGPTETGPQLWGTGGEIAVYHENGL